ncbi:prepilin-type N-terminal cleavage/methylation domain-containing protein [bacterium]|nr:prepilin-type N-terminal cleavage/methylation domain-containing protein [bacterium]
MRKNAFTIVELIVSVAILTIVSFAVLKAFLGGQKHAAFEMQSHVVNEDVHRLTQLLIEDIRKSTGISPDCAGLQRKCIEMTDYLELDKRDENPDNKENTLILTRVKPDFSKDPPIFSTVQTSYAVKVVENKNPNSSQNETNKPNPKIASGSLKLVRSIQEFDSNGSKVGSPIVSDFAVGFDKINFYRIRSVGCQTVFFRLFKSRRDPKHPDAEMYTVKFVGSAKIRNSEPEGAVVPTI